MDLQLVLYFVFVMVGSALAQHSNHNHEEHRVNVAVYYESLCPDSRRFFTRQLYPSLLTNLSNYVNLTLVPYGKSKTTTSEDQFECHHGPAECYGNKIQACALKLIKPDATSKGFNKVSVGFINCLMEETKREGVNATFPTNECATKNAVTNINDITNCANHTDGSKAFADLGKITDSLQQPLKSVPTIVFNDRYKQDDSKQAESNFVKALCQYIQGDKPAECSKNGAHSLQISLGIVLLAALLSRYSL